jgi:hypothetical protein
MTRVLRFILLASVGLASLQAATRGSANYTVSTEILDTAGEPATSQSYRNTPSVGGCAGPAATTASNAAVQPGFIAQLAPVTRLALTANGTAVAETGTSQLAAWEILADSTRAPLAPAAVTWSAASGPISVSSAGLVSAAPVAQDAAAVAAAAYAGFNATMPLTVFNTAGDNFGSYANDGLPDDWQTLYFGVANPNAAPGLDPDHDGFTNVFEYAAGLDPTNSASRFSLTLQPVPGQPARKNIVFNPRYDTASYTVEASTDLTHWSPLTNFATTDSGTQRTVTDLAATQANKFYRVVITATGLAFTYANDGIPDDWQTIYFGVANPNGAPTADPDHDGQTNAFEYAAGLDPTDPASRFSLTLHAVPGQPARKNLVFSPRYDTARYTVEASTDVIHWSPLSDFTTTDSGIQRTVTDLAATGASKLYRVVIVRP